MTPYNLKLTRITALSIPPSMDTFLVQAVAVPRDGRLPKRYVAQEVPPSMVSKTGKLCRKLKKEMRRMVVKAYELQ